MDIHIIKKCRVVKKDIQTEQGHHVWIPITTKQDVFAYVVTKPITSLERDKIQCDLERMYTSYD